MPLRTIEDLGDLAGKRVLLRVDFNVPLQNGAVTDDLRIAAALPTIGELRQAGAALVLATHLGRPKGRVSEELRLGPVAARLQEVGGFPVRKLDQVTGKDVTRACGELTPGDVLLLENLRFDPGEEANDPDLAADLARLGDLYVNDAFGAAHRAHASIVGVPERLPSAAGLLLTEEVEKLERVLHGPEHPFVAVLGGAKVSDKLSVIGNLLDRVDSMCVGGAMAFTLLKAGGRDVGRSMVEEDRVDEVERVLKEAESRGVEVLLPDDVVAAESPDEGAAHETVLLDEIADRMGVDIGPRTASRFQEEIAAARTVLWNGPMGIFEIEAFSAGTRTVADAIAQATRSGAYTVAGGGDSAAALRALDQTDAVSHLSTGGGASLELLEGKELPGIAALRAKEGGS